jgi:hypothetical protein
MADNRRIAQPSSSRPIIKDDGSASTQFNTWIKVITEQSVIIGGGNPEGVVPAQQAAIYMDELGTDGAIVYIKRDSDDGFGDTTKGWVLV